MALFGKSDNIENSDSAPRAGSSKNRSMLEKANIDYQQQYHSNIEKHIRLSPGYDYAQSIQMANSIFSKRSVLCQEPIKNMLPVRCMNR